VVWFYPASGDFRADNPFWNGVQTLCNQHNVTPINAFSDLPSSATGTAVIIVPYTQFTEAELTQTRNYVSTGGTLILLDDYGYGNQVLDSLGSKIKFNSQPLLDPLFAYQNKWLPKITDFTNTPLKANVSSIVFNHATTLEAESGIIVAESSSFSFLDLNYNQIRDANEPTGPLPVAAYQKIGQGYVVAVSDPSILINCMIDQGDNLQFIQKAAALQTAAPRIYIDQTHLPTSALDEAKETLAVIYGAAASPVGTLLAASSILAFTLYPLWKKVKKHDKNNT
jgi:hypothetical protein